MKFPSSQPMMHFMLSVLYCQTCCLRWYKKGQISHKLIFGCMQTCLHVFTVGFGGFEVRVYLINCSRTKSQRDKPFNFQTYSVKSRLCKMKTCTYHTKGKLQFCTASKYHQLPPTTFLQFTLMWVLTNILFAPYETYLTFNLLQSAMNEYISL